MILPRTLLWRNSKTQLYYNGSISHLVLSHTSSEPNVPAAFPYNLLRSTARVNLDQHSICSPSVEAQLTCSQPSSIEVYTILLQIMAKGQWPFQKGGRVKRGTKRVAVSFPASEVWCELRQSWIDLCFLTRSQKGSVFSLLLGYMFKFRWKRREKSGGKMSPLYTTVQCRVQSEVEGCDWWTGEHLFISFIHLNSSMSREC